MSWIAAATLGVTLTSQGVKAVKGSKQKRDAKNLARQNSLKKYVTPPEVIEATRVAERQMNNGNPLEARAKEDVSRASSNAMANATSASASSNDLLDSIAKIHKMETDAFNDVNTASAVYEQRATDAYRDALETQARYTDKAWQVNEHDPYIRKANTAASMYGAGEMNQMSAIDGAATSLMAFGNSIGVDQGKYKERLSPMEAAATFGRYKY